jgi:hypothetical protein
MITFEAFANIDSTQLFIVLTFITYLGIIDLNRRFSRVEERVDEALNDVENDTDVETESEESFDHEEVEFDEEDDVSLDYYREGWEDVLNDIECLREF